MKLFTDLELPEVLQAALAKINFVEPTEIQRKALPLLMDGKDVIACSETGSGKTGAYLIPMVKELLENPDSQGMVLAPTRELAQQISEFLLSIVPPAREFHTTRLVGGQDIRKQFKSLQRKPRVIVATPGRLIDHLKRNTVQIGATNLLVLDEGDRMIDMGFAPQLKQILKHLPEKRQTSFFTATVDKKVTALASQYLDKPVKVMVGDSRPVSAIKQTVLQVEFKDKDDCIVQELNSRSGSVIIFLKTKHRTDRLHQYLSSFGFDVDIIHGGRTQGQRNRAISDFKKGKSRVLCATDVAARGIDVPHVEHVINFDLPMQDEDYVHRIGRTARNGAEGEAISLVTPNEHRDWNRLARKYDIKDSMLEEKRGSHSSRGRESGGRTYGKKKSSAGGRFKSPRSRSQSNNDDRPDRRRDSRSTRPRDEDSGGFKKKFGKGRRDEEGSSDRRSRDGDSSFKKKFGKGRRDEEGSSDRRSRDGDSSFKKKFGKGRRDEEGSSDRRSRDGDSSFKKKFGKSRRDEEGSGDKRSKSVSVKKDDGGFKKKSFGKTGGKSFGKPSGFKEKRFIKRPSFSKRLKYDFNSF